MQAWRKPSTSLRRTLVVEARRSDPGVIILRYRSKLLHPIGIGRAPQGRPGLVLACDLGIRVITADGELLRRLTLTPFGRLPGHLGRGRGRSNRLLNSR